MRNPIILSCNNNSQNANILNVRILRRCFEGNFTVRVISRKKLKQAASIHAELATSLDAWYRIAKKAEWASMADLRVTWSSADIFEECTIFNIKGNKYRLIAWINYRTKKIFIRSVLTHAEYTKGGWKNDCSSR